MRTNIEIDDELMARALEAGPFTTKKEAVEAGLRLLARQAAYREILKWRGKLQWEGDESIDWTLPPPHEATMLIAREPAPGGASRAGHGRAAPRGGASSPAQPDPRRNPRRARR